MVFIKRLCCPTLSTSHSLPSSWSFAQLLAFQDPFPSSWPHDHTIAVVPLFPCPLLTPGHTKMISLLLHLFILLPMSLNFPSGAPFRPSSYAEHSVVQILEPVVRSVAELSYDIQLSILTLALTTMMEAWSDHILKEEVIFRFAM